MSEELRSKGKDFARFMDSLSDEEIRKGNEIEFKHAEEEFKNFKKSFSEGECYLCGKPLTSFSKKAPCIHWLLKPKGFKKKDFRSISKIFGIYQIQSYLRWLANEEYFAKNINDLAEEGTRNKIIEVTIKFENIEWSFSCAESDYTGHSKSQHAKHPHYHFQMRINQRPFINFSDFHPELSEMDIIKIEAMRLRPDKLKSHFSFGEGMSDILNHEVIEHVLNSSSNDCNYEEAPISIDSMVFAKEGEVIKGEDLYKIFEEAKAKGGTHASLLHKLPNTETKITVGPGPGVVEKAARKGRKKGK